MPTPALSGGLVTTMAASTPHAIPTGPYRLLADGAVTFATTVGGSYSTLTGATAEPGALVSGGFVQGASTRVVVLKKINSISSSYASLVGRSNPLSYYRLGEQTGSTLYDSVNTNNLTKGSGVTLGTAGPLGDSNLAVTLDGTVNGMGSVTGPNTWSGGTALSFEAWVYNAAWSASHEVIVSLGSTGIYMSVVAGKLIMSIHLGSQYTNTALPALAFVADTWYHVAVTWETGNQIRLYANGAELTGDTTTVRSGALSSSPNIYVGNFGGSALFYSGVVDEVAIYLRKLTASEIKNHYTGRLVK